MNADPARANHGGVDPQRKIGLTALEDGWREALRHVERRPVGALAGAFDGADADWAQREYGRTCHTDGRVRDRILRMGRAWLKSMGGDLPVIFPEKAEQKAAYRLLSNPRISMQHILEPHCEATADRCRGEAVVLAMQDTTALNYTGLEATEGLADIGGGGKGSKGILAHAGLAVTPEGRPLGLFTMDAAFREDPGRTAAAGSWGSSGHGSSRRPARARG